MSSNSEPLLQVHVADGQAKAAYEAAGNNDVATLRSLSPEACQQSHRGMLPLHWAAARNSLPAMAFLASLPGADVNAADCGGRTPLMHAVAARAEEAIVWLTRHGGRLDDIDEKGSAASHWAARMGSASIVALLANLGANMEVLDKDGRTPLETAVTSERLEVVEHLVLTHGSSQVALSSAQAAIQNLAPSPSRFWIARCLEKQVGCHEAAEEDSRFCGPIHGSLALPISARCFRGPEQVQMEPRLLSLWTGSLSIVVSIVFIAWHIEYQTQAAADSRRFLAFLALSCTLVGWPCFFRASRKPCGVERIENGESYQAALACAAAVAAEDCERQVFNWWGEAGPVIHQLAMVGPLRSKYCSATRRCIPVFDHYCTFLRNPVGMENYCAFAATVVLATTACTSLSLISLSLMKIGSGGVLVACVALWFGAFALAGLALCTVHLMLACRGWTTHELIQVVRSRTPPYMIDEETGAYSNPYNNGCVRNLIARLCDAQISVESSF